MENNGKQEFTDMFVGWIITIILTVITGVLLWNLINPKGFFSALGFLVLLLIASKIINILVVIVLQSISE